MATVPSGAAVEEGQLKPIPWYSFKQQLARSQAKTKSQMLTERAKLARENPEEAKQAYDAARKSMFGDLPATIDTGCQTCLLKAKAASRKARKDLTDKALASGCSACKEKAMQLRADMDEVENMRCAKQVYLAEDPNAPADLKRPPVGFCEPTKQDLADMGLTEDMLRPDGTSFRAHVYMKDPEIWSPPSPPDPKAVVAFRGSTPALEDWENNSMQGANSDPGFINPSTQTVNDSYYKRAVEIGKAVSRSSKSVPFVGHSLAGGLASAAQGASGGTAGNPASTYNAAGLHSNTVAKYAGSGASADAGKINAIRVDGEVLTKAQESDLIRMAIPKAVGMTRNLKPSLSKAQYRDGQGRFDKQAAAQMGQEYDEDDAYSTQLHSMDEVIGAMEAQKQANQTALEFCAANKHDFLDLGF